MNLNWRHAEYPVPPYTSIAWDYNPGGNVCDLNGTSEWTTNLSNPKAKYPSYRERIPLSYFWDNDTPVFDGCWEGMDDSI